MKKINFSKLFNALSFFSSNDSRFELRTALMVLAVPLIGMCFFCFTFWHFLSAIQSFFMALGIENSEAIFYDYLFNALNEQFPFLILYFSIIFFVGSYLSILLLRPFRKIEGHCRHSLANPTAYLDFQTSGLESKKLLTRMSMLFFQFIAICRQSKVFEAQVMDEEIEKINSPRPDLVFYFQYFVILMIIALFCGVGLYVFMIDTFDAIVSLAQHDAKNHADLITVFLTQQGDALESIFVATALLVTVLYIFLCRHIVQTVNGVSFALFRYMRQIMRGDFTTVASVRLKDPGHSAVESFNSFLDQVIPENIRHKRIEQKDTAVDEEEEGPPAIITEEKRDEDILYHLITSEGDKIISKSKDRIKKILKKIAG